MLDDVLVDQAGSDPVGGADDARLLVRAECLERRVEVVLNSQAVLEEDVRRLRVLRGVGRREQRGEERGRALDLGDRLGREHDVRVGLVKRGLDRREDWEGIRVIPTREQEDVCVRRSGRQLWMLPYLRLWKCIPLAVHRLCLVGADGAENMSTNL